MKKISIFLTAACVLFLGSCASTNYLTIDIMKPASVSFAPQIVNLTVVDNSGIQPDSVNHIFSDSYGSNNISTVTLEVPDSSKMVFKEAFVQFMNEENYFNKVQLYPHNLRTDDDFDKTRVLRAEEVQQICEQTDADALVSLDMYIVSTNIENSYMPYAYGLFLEMKGLIGLSVRIYDKEGRTISRPVIQLDSAFWSQPSIARLPKRTDALKELALISAEKLTKQFIPYWEKQNRYYFTDGTSAMKEATKNVKEGKWKEAAVIWGAVFEDEEKDIRKAKLATNIALANECLDDIENAVKWIDIAYDLLIEKKGDNDLILMTTVYRSQLKLREKDMSALKDQLGVDEEEEDPVNSQQ